MKKTTVGVDLGDIKKASPSKSPKSKSNIKWEDHYCASLFPESEREQKANERQHASVRQAALSLTSFSARLGRKQTLKHSQNNKQAFINSAIYIYKSLEGEREKHRLMLWVSISHTTHGVRQQGSDARRLEQENSGLPVPFSAQARPWSHSACLI